MEKVRLFEFDFWNASDEYEVVHQLTDSDNKGLFEKDNVNFIITPNAYDIAEYFTTYNDIRRMLVNAAVVLADGIPIIWYSKLYNPSLKKRITGSDLFPALWDAIKRERKKAFFILPTKKIAEKLHEEYPSVLYAIPDFFDKDDDDYIKKFVSLHIDDILAYQPDFIFIGITIPKQQKIALEIHHLLSGKSNFNCLVAILGASFEYYLGLKKRAPVFFQKTGTEWLYRFAQEPGRMWRRYTIGNLKFFIIVIGQLFKKKIPENIK